MTQCPTAPEATRTPSGGRTGTGTRHRSACCSRGLTLMLAALVAAGCSPKADTPWSSSAPAGEAGASAAAVASAPASASGTVAAASAPVPSASQSVPPPLSNLPAASSPLPAASAASGALPGASAVGVGGAVGGSGTSPAQDPALAVVTDAPLLVPVDGVQPNQLLDTYEQSRSEGRTHEAIDILAPRGTPVRAVADGKVAKLFTSRLGGLTVYQFDRQERIAYYYAHLDAYAPGLKEGQTLRRGDPVGTVGFTGNANPQAPHLHFAVFVLGPERRWWEGSPLNPYPLMQPAAGRATAQAESQTSTR